MHHGNGTEETIRWLKPGVEDVALLDSSLFGSLAMPRYKPWFDQNDTDNVLFVSVHGYGPREKGLEHMMPQAAFYPGSGKTIVPEVTKPAGASSSVASSGDGDGDGPVAGAGGAGANASAAAGKAKTASKEDGMAKSSNKSRMSEATFSGVRSPKGQDNSSDEGGEGGEGEDEGEGMDANDENEDEDEDDDFNGSAHGDGDDDDDDDDDDDMDDDEGEGVAGAALDTAGSESSRLNRRLSTMRKLYTKPPLSALSSSGRPPVPPLILDVGVPLPESPEVTSSDYRHMWRNYFREEIFPSLMRFKPDLLLISAGFDAHKKDTINGGYIALVEEDFEWVTSHLVRIANSTCEGRVVSVLEGGYQILGEHCSAFAKSVKAHVAALASGARTNTPYSQNDSDIEKQVEADLLNEAARKRAEKAAREMAAMEALREARRLELAAAAAAADESGAQSSESGGGQQHNSDATAADDGSRKRRRAQVSVIFSLASSLL